MNSIRKLILDDLFQEIKNIIVQNQNTKIQTNKY